MKWILCIFFIPPFLSTSSPLYLLACCAAYIKPNTVSPAIDFHREESKGQQIFTDSGVSACPSAMRLYLYWGNITQAKHIYTLFPAA